MTELTNLLWVQGATMGSTLCRVPFALAACSMLAGSTRWQHCSARSSLPPSQLSALIVHAGQMLGTPGRPLHHKIA